MSLSYNKLMVTEDTIRGSIEAVQEAFRQVAPLILSNAGQAKSADKPDGSPVTETDLAAEKQIIEFLNRHFPGLPVVGEETGYDINNLPESCWLIDPIDGTRSYIKNIPAYTSMGVLLHRGRAEASVIYNPSSKDMYVAWAGRGAFKNGNKLDLLRVPLPSIMYCKEQFVEKMNDYFASGHVIAQSAPSGAGEAFSLVASGQSAARFQLLPGGYLHDYATGALLVREAGGDLIPILEDNYTYRTRSFVACHPGLSDLVRENLPYLRQLENPDNTAL